MLRYFIFIVIVMTMLEGQSLKKVVFNGNKALSTKYLEENLNILVEKSWYEFYKDDSPKIDKAVIKPLSDSLINLYKSEGFYKVRVSSYNNDDNITFMIEENRPLVINDINITMPKKYRELIDFKIGDRFVVNTFMKIRKNLRKQLSNDGYCNAELTTKAYIDLKKYSCYLIYKLKKNKKCKFGKIEVETQSDIPKKVILSRLYYRTGDDYSSKILLRSYETILGLDVFDTINIKQENFGDRINTKIITTKKQTLIKRMIGVGYETKYGPRVIFGWERRNFKGGARKLSFETKYSKNEQYAKNTFFFPSFIKEPFWHRYIDLKNDFIVSKTKYDRFDETKVSDRLHFLKDIEFISIDGGISYERIKIFKTDPNGNRISDGDFTLLSPYIKAIIDSRDSKVDPKNGIYISGYFESGLTYLASSTSYSKMILEGRAIKTILGFTIAAKAKVGMIKEFEKHLPESKLFFAGGAYSNRAYGYNRLGAFDSDNSSEEVGAKTLVDNSLEISHHLWEKLSWALFWDATMLSSKEANFDLEFKHSYGFGLRYKTAIGPVKIDYGIDSKDSSIRAIHFQIGQSF